MMFHGEKLFEMANWQTKRWWRRWRLIRNVRFYDNCGNFWCHDSIIEQFEPHKCTFGAVAAAAVVELRVYRLLCSIWNKSINWVKILKCFMIRSHCYCFCALCDDLFSLAVSVCFLAVLSFNVYTNDSDYFIQ